MQDIIRTIHHFSLYLLPASLLATAGILLAALLYYPVSSTAPSSTSRAAVVADHEYWRSHAEALFAAMAAEALRQLQEEQSRQVRTLQYRYEYALPLAKRPTLPRHGNGVAEHPALVHL